MITAILIGAGQRGAMVYGEYARKHPNEIKIVGVAEPDQERRKFFQAAHHILDEMAFENWEDLLAKGKIADAAMVCTMDQGHVKPVIEALACGYQVMCEKPMSPSAKTCMEMAQASKKYGKTLTICHVLRYSGFFSKIKELVDSGGIGDIVAVQHMERVGYWHQAHSFVRGNWRNAGESSPMILQKSCHDMDILSWLIGEKCVAVSSFGSLKHFRKEEAPENSGAYCIDDCRIADTCPYAAQKIYLQDEEWYSDTIRGVISQDKNMEHIAKKLRRGPYGRCVYRCDNDVVDHQVVNLQFEKEITASFIMCAFTYEGSRILNIMGTRGEIKGDMEKNQIEIYDFRTGNKTEISIKAEVGGHSGSDDHFMQGWIKTVETEGNDTLSTAAESLESHLIALAAEESRVTGKTIYMKDYYESIAK